MVGERGERGERGYNGTDGKNGNPCLEDHDLLIRLDTKMDTILERLGMMDDCMKDHEKRIVKVEGFQSTVLAFSAAIALGISIAGKWFLSMLGGSS